MNSGCENILKSASITAARKDGYNHNALIVKPQKTAIPMKYLSNYHGMPFSCKASGEKTFGRVYVAPDESVFLCLDEYPSAFCVENAHLDEYFGYKYFLSVCNDSQEGLKECLEENSITHFRLLDKEDLPKDFCDFRPGDLLHDTTDGPWRGESMTVIFRCGELVVCKTANEHASTNFTCAELLDRGYRLELSDPSPEEPVDVTLDEIARWKGVAVSRIKVKKE